MPDCENRNGDSEAKQVTGFRRNKTKTDSGSILFVIPNLFRDLFNCHPELDSGSMKKQ